MKNLYLVQRKDNADYEEYESFTVVAEDEKTAVRLVIDKFLKYDHEYLNEKNLYAEFISLEGESKIVNFNYIIG